MLEFLRAKRNRYRGFGVPLLYIAIINVLGLLIIWSSMVGLPKWHSDRDENFKFVYNSGSVIIKLANSTDGRSVYTVEKFDRIIHQVQLSENFDGDALSVDIQNGSVFVVNGFERSIKFEIQEDDSNFTLIKVSTELKADQRDTHCVSLKTGRMHWFGGPARKNQFWPIEKHQYSDDVANDKIEVSFNEQYWLNSRGGFIYVDETVPLFDDQNTSGNNLCLKVMNEPPYNTHREAIHLIYYLGVGQDAREAQRMAVKRFLGKPTGMPDRQMIRDPIWSTWRRFYRRFNQTAIKLYASEIEKYGFKHSQIEIDDGWEICYGSLTFKPDAFPNVRRLTRYLKAHGFRVTLWTHPFVDEGCEPWYSEAKQNGYLVKTYNGSTQTLWWNNKEENQTTSHIDFTNPAATEWYVNRLKKLQRESGIDSYKFDGGEAFSLPKDSKLNADVGEHPMANVKAYVRMASQFGPMVEVRTGSHTQDVPIYARIRDRKSAWHHRYGGFTTLIPSLLNMNINGYVFCIPDMIGGQSLNKPTEELFIRWLQVSVFMPSIQFSFPPWNYSADALKLSKKFTNLHAEYADEIIDVFETAIERGEPVNPPIWWLDPNDDVALSINDEFLLGDRILSAPVVHQNEVLRDIYLPRGEWYDPNLNETYFGPHWLKNYPAPIDVLPYFIRKKSNQNHSRHGSFYTLLS